MNEKSAPYMVEQSLELDYINHMDSIEGTTTTAKKDIPYANNSFERA